MNLAHKITKKKLHIQVQYLICVKKIFSDNSITYFPCLHFPIQQKFNLKIKINLTYKLLDLHNSFIFRTFAV
jgi:hypothetical protein